MKKIHLVTSAIALVLMLGLFGSVANAATLSQAGATGVAVSEEKDSTERRPVRVVGIVVEVHDNGIFLRTRLGPVRVRVTENTTIRVPDNGECVEGTLEDLQVGEPAVVVGILTPERVIIARGIAQCRPETGGSE
jgi:hypothetical protein